MKEYSDWIAETGCTAHTPVGSWQRWPVDYEVRGSLTVSDTMFGLDAALEGVGLAYTYRQLAEPHIRAKRLKRVLTRFSPTFPGFFLYYPSRHDQPMKLKAFIRYMRRTVAAK